jgi:hypothetical protein
MPVRSFGVPRDGHDRITIGDETLLLTGDIAFELDLLVIDVLVMDREV